MANMHVIVNHNLPKDEAIKRIGKLLEDTKKQFGNRIKNLEESWKDGVGKFSFEALGYPVSGVIRVTAKRAEIQGELPWQAALFKGRIEAVIKEQASGLLS